MLFKTQIYIGRGETLKTNLITYVKSLIPEYKEGHPDFQEIIEEKKKTIGIDKVRELIRLAQLKPFQSEYKIIVIHNADALTQQAQNALLKILEEPPENTQIILMAQNQNNFLDTVLSRCELIFLPDLRKKQDNNINLPSDIIEEYKFIDELKTLKTPSEKEERIRDFFSQLLFSAKEEFAQTPEIATGKKTEKKLKLINETLYKLNANVNSKLLLESFFIKLREI